MNVIENFPCSLIHAYGKFLYFISILPTPNKWWQITFGNTEKCDYVSISIRIRFKVEIYSKYYYKMFLVFGIGSHSGVERDGNDDDDSIKRY